MMAPAYRVGDSVLYSSTPGAQQPTQHAQQQQQGPQAATVVGVHLDDAPNVYYTVRLGANGQERQTVEERLQPRPQPPPQAQPQPHAQAQPQAQPQPQPQAQAQPYGQSQVPPVHAHAQYPEQHAQSFHPYEAQPMPQGQRT